MDSGANNGGLIMKVDSSGVLQYGYKFYGTTSTNDYCRGVDSNKDGRVAYISCYTE